MTTSRPSLYLISPRIDDAAAFAPTLAAACASGEVEVVLLRLSPKDERGLVNEIKLLAPIAQKHGIAVIVADPGGETDLANVITRGGADGGHGDDPLRVAALRERLKEGRSVGAGGLRTRHDAMEAGERGVDYVLFGEPKPDGYVPPLDDVEERAEWWAQIFETPCVVYAPSLAALPRLAATGAEFLALGEAIWGHAGGPEAALSEARRILGAVPENAA